MIRHAQSHNEFPTEGIPLCQVNQPRSESSENIILINVPVVTSNINEKKQMKKNGESKVSEQKKNLGDVKKARFDEDEDEFSKRDSKQKALGILGDSDGSCRRYPCDSYSFTKNLGQIEKRNWKEAEKTQEMESLFFIESSDLHFSNKKDCYHFRDEGVTNSKPKPKRYNRSSLKKQKFRLYDDEDLETQQNNQENCKKQCEYECGNELVRKPKDLKTAEMKRKAFLRKVSLQETYLNYNQDYWLDFKNSGRFHKSIDLGYFGNDENMDTRAEIPQENKKISKNNGQNFSLNRTIGSRSLVVKSRQSKVPSNTGALENSNRCDSDPIIFLNKDRSCKDYQLTPPTASSNTSIELFTQIIDKCKLGNSERRKNSWFVLPSNENIPLFSERNGLIETDFDVLNDMKDAECLLIEKTGGFEDDSSQEKRKQSGELQPDANYYIPIDFSGFYEIKLSNSNNDLVEENVKRSTVFNFQGGQAFFGENIKSMSHESDLFMNDVEPTGSNLQEMAVRIRSSSNSD